MNVLWAMVSAGIAIGMAAIGQEPPTPVFGTTVVGNAGLEGRIYMLHKNASQLPDFDRLKPKGTIYTSSLNVPPQHFNLGFPGVTKRFEWFAIDYNGKFWIEKPGLYHFSLESDDGSKLYIDDQLIVDHDGQHPPQSRLASLQLSYGTHAIRVSYFQGPRDYVALRLRVAAPGENYKIFSTEEYKPPANPEDWHAPGAPAPAKAPAPAASPEPSVGALPASHPRFETTITAPAGITGRVYDIPAGTKKLPNLDTLKSIGTISRPTLGIRIADLDPIAIDFAGKFWIEEAGLYRFSLHSEDGAKLFIDRQLD